ncbi:hypothetical protein ACSG6T_000277 [Enterococcus faecalis]
MTKGLPVSIRDIRKYGKKIRLYTGEQGIVLHHLVSYRKQVDTNGKKTKHKRTIHEPLYVVYDRVKYVFDRHGIKIAERKTADSPLLSTGKGYFKRLSSYKSNQNGRVMVNNEVIIDSKVPVSKKELESKGYKVKSFDVQKNDHNKRYNPKNP